MKQFEIVAATKVVAQFRVSESVFVCSFNGLPSKLEAFIKKQHAEYSSCNTMWKWENPKTFLMEVLSFGDAVINEK